VLGELGVRVCGAGERERETSRFGCGAILSRVAVSVFWIWSLIHNVRGCYSTLSMGYYGIKVIQKRNGGKCTNDSQFQLWKQRDCGRGSGLLSGKREVRGCSGRWAALGIVVDGPGEV
jgi:hypothetical protein